MLLRAGWGGRRNWLSSRFCTSLLATELPRMRNSDPNGGWMGSGGQCSGLGFFGSARCGVPLFPGVGPVRRSLCCRLRAVVPCLCRRFVRRSIQYKAGSKSLVVCGVHHVVVAKRSSPSRSLSNIIFEICYGTSRLLCLSCLPCPFCACAFGQVCSALTCVFACPYCIPACM